MRNVNRNKKGFLVTTANQNDTCQLSKSNEVARALRVLGDLIKIVIIRNSSESTLCMPWCNTQRSGKQKREKMKQNKRYNNMHKSTAVTRRTLI